MGCKHVTDLRWCYDCGKKRAESKPNKTFEPGWYAIPEEEDVPGVVTFVTMILLGLNVDQQRWVEYVTVRLGSGLDWEGPADKVTRLVAAK